jgi:hypothetical protein
MFKRKLSESESQRLPDSASRGVAMVSRRVAIQIFLNLSSLSMAKPALLKDQFGKKEARDVMYYHH